MKANQFKPLSAKEIDVIEILTSKWTSQRQIQRITNHGRTTIRKYQYAYYNRKIIEWLDKHFAESEWVQVYRISFWFVWLVMMLIIVLSGCGLYFLINL